MDNPNPIRYSDLIVPDDSITKLIDQLEDLIAEYNKAKTSIQGAAQEAAKGLQSLSGATEEQRKAIQLTTEESDKLVKQYRDVTTASWKATQAFAEATAAKKEAAQIDKLVTQINTSAEGSYNRLSAQYRLNKIRLNEMSLAERQGTEAGKALEAETNAIYEEMKRLQEATGKHTLNVGNYADAAKGLKMELTSLIQQMAYLKANGEQNSQEYQEMAQRAGQLKDAMVDAQTEVKNMASDTQQLDATMGVASAASGGIAAVTGAMNIMGASSETASEAQKNLGTTMGIVSGITAVQNALQKESNIMTGIRILQTKAAAKAEALDTAAKKKDTAATVGATVAQGAFNIVAKANPYVLLAIALITVIGALAAFSAGASKAAKEQKKLNEQTSANLDYLEQYSASQTRANNERIKALSNELEIANARKAGLAETSKLEDEIYKERVKAHDKQMEIYSEQLAGLDTNIAKLDTLYSALERLKVMQAQGKTKVRIDVDMDGKIERVKIEDAIDAIQGQIDNLGRSVKVATELQTEGAEINKQRQIQLINRRNAAQQAANTERDILRASLDARIALIKDGFKRERNTIAAAALRQIEDLERRLKTESGLTKKARTAIQEQIKAVRAKYYDDLLDLQRKYAAIDREITRETEDLEIALMAEGADKRRKELEVEYARQIADLTRTLEEEKDLTLTQQEQIYNQTLLLGEKYRKEREKLDAEIHNEQLSAQNEAIELRLETVAEGSKEEFNLRMQLLSNQRQIEINENKLLAEELRQSEADINAKYDALELKEAQKFSTKMLEITQKRQTSEFALLDRNERQKALFTLQQERARLQKMLEIDDAAGKKMSEEARKTIENTIKAIDKEAKRKPFNNLYELLGLNVTSEQQDALDTAFSSVKESLDSIIDSWKSLADAAVDAANKQVESAQRVLDAEIEAREEGYANEVLTAQKELDLAKKNQQKALKEQQKAQQAQMALDSVTQASSLVTATANLWKAFSGAGAFGIAAAIAATALMWGSFAAAKVKAYQVSRQTEKYGEGTVELLQGGSHASGNDIDLGMKKNGTRRRAEGGEFFAVINKRNSRKYRSIIPDVINSFNNGTFSERYQKASLAMAGSAVNMMASTDVSTLEKDVAAIRKQGDDRTYVDPQGNIVICHKNLIRKIKS